MEAEYLFLPLSKRRVFIFKEFHVPSYCGGDMVLAYFSRIPPQQGLITLLIFACN